MRSSCVRNARNVASAMRPLPNRSRKPVLFVTELLQSLGNGRANESELRRNRSRQRKIDLPSHVASAWQAIGDSGDTECHAFATADPCLWRTRRQGWQARARLSILRAI